MKKLLLAASILSILVASFLVFGGGVENASAQLLGPIEMDNGGSPPGSPPPQSLSFWLTAGNDPVEPAPNSYMSDVYVGYRKTVKVWVNYPDNYGPPANLQFTATSISVSSPLNSSVHTGPLTTTTPLIGSVGNVSVGNPLSNYISFDKDYCKIFSQDGQACVGMIINAPAGYNVLGNHIITVTAKRPLFAPRDIFHLNPYENFTGTMSYVANVTTCPVGQNCSESETLLSSNGLNASYYSDSNLSVLIGTQTDNEIDFSSECGPYNTPGPCSTASGARSYPFGFDGTDSNFSIRWEGYYYNSTAGNKSWAINHDDGMRIWINDTLVLSDWGQATGPNPTATNPIFLQANTYNSVKVEFQQVACCAARTIIGFEPQNLYVSLPTSTSNPQAQRCAAITAENLGEQGINDLSCPPPSGILITDNTDLTYGSSTVDSSPSQNVAVPLEVRGIESSTIGLTADPVVNLSAAVYPDSSIVPNLGVINTPAGPISTGITASAGVSASLSMPSCQTTCYPVLNIETPEDTIPGTYNIVVTASRTGQASVQGQSLEQGTYVYTLIVQPVQSIDPIIQQIEDAIALIITKINDLIGGGIPGATTTPFNIYDSDFNYIVGGTGVFQRNIDVTDNSYLAVNEPPVRLNYTVSGDSPNSISASFVYPETVPYPIPPPCGSAHCAGFISQNVPIFMAPGSTHNVSITMYNSGTDTWTSSGLYRLGSQNPQDNGTWGTHRVELPNSVSPGQSVTFNFSVTAPTTPGRYGFQWNMVHDGVQWFGDSTDNITVNVTTLSPYDACVYYLGSLVGLGEAVCSAVATITVPANTPIGKYVLKVTGDSHVTGSYYSSMYYVINVGSNPCPSGTTGPGVPNCTPDECPQGQVGSAGACVVPPSVFTHTLVDQNITYQVNMNAGTTYSESRIKVIPVVATIPPEGKTVSFTPTVTKVGALNTTGFTASASSCNVTVSNTVCFSTLTITASQAAAGQYIVSFVSSANDGSAPSSISYTVTVSPIQPCPSGTTGTFPSCTPNPIPCPAGTTGSGVPNCVPNPTNPTPAITKLTPESGFSGSSSQSITIDGTGFLSSSIVKYNGVARTSSYVSSSRLTATLLSSDFNTANNLVAVENPVPCQATCSSNPMVFPVIPPPFILTDQNNDYVVNSSGVNISAPRTIKVTLPTSTSPRTVTLTKTTIPSAGLSITPAIPSCDIPALATTCNINISFTPTQVGRYTASFQTQGVSQTGNLTYIVNVAGPVGTYQVGEGCGSFNICFPDVSANTTSQLNTVSHNVKVKVLTGNPQAVIFDPVQYTVQQGTTTLTVSPFQVIFDRPSSLDPVGGCLVSPTFDSVCSVLKIRVIDPNARDFYTLTFTAVSAEGVKKTFTVRVRVF